MDLRTHGTYQVTDLANAAFIGRTKELEGLLADLPGSEDSPQGCLTTISGDAGIGKSRLLAEIARKAELRGHRVLWSERIENPGAPPLFTWVLAIRSCLGDYTDEALIHDLGVGAQDVASLVPELQDRFDVPATKHGEDSVAARFQMFDSVSRFLLASAKRRPLVVLLDNLHLADRSSLELLEYFSQQLSGYPVNVIAAYRTLEHDDGAPLKSSLDRLSLSARFSQISLHGLDRGEVTELLSIHSQASLPASLATSVYQQSGGNPLFVVEVAKMLQRRSAELPLPAVGFHFDLPASLRDLIHARLDAIPAATRTMLGEASVLGRTFDIASWQALSDESDDQVLALMQSAEDAGIVDIVKSGRYRFQHALYREVLYSQLSRSDRADMHVAASRHFEKWWNDGDESVLSQLAYHYFEVASLGFSRKAVYFNREAALVAQMQRAYSESAIFLEQALASLELSSDADNQVEFGLLLALGKALFSSGQQFPASEPLLRASRLAEKARDWPALAESLLELQWVHGQQGIANDSCLPLFEALLPHLTEESEKLRAIALASLADAQRLTGNKELATKTAIESMALAKELADPRLRLDCFCRCVWAIGCSATYPETFEYQQAQLWEIQEITRLYGTAEESLLVMTAIGFHLCSRGTAAELQTHLNAFRHLMESVHHPHYSNVLAGIEISFNILQGKWNDAMRDAITLQRRAHLQDVAGLDGSFGQQMFVIQRSRGRLAGVATLIEQIEANVDPDKLWLPGQILMHCDLANWHRARKLLSHIGDLANLARDDMYIAALVYLAEACVALNDRMRLIELYKLLKPFRKVIASIPCTTMMGAVSGYMALVAAHIDKRKRAHELFEEALILNSAMAAAPWLARVQVDYTQFLLRSQNVKYRARAQKLASSARRTAEELELTPLLARLDKMASATDIGQLTPRERAVLALIAKGSSNKAIAAELSVSLSTVATHVRNILRKLHVNNRTEAADFARRAAWVE